MKLEVKDILNLSFIKEDYPLEKSYFLIPENLLRLNFLWPHFKQTPLVILVNILNSLALLGTGILIFIAAAQVFKYDPLAALDPVGPGMSFVITFVKFAYFWYFKKEYKEVIEIGRELFLADKNIEKNPEKRKNMSELTNLAAKLTLMTFLTSIFTDFSFIAKNVIDYIGDRDSYFILFDVYYPYEENLSGFPYFQIFYAMLMYAALMISTTIAAVDGLCVTFSMYFAAMFKTLQYEFKEMFNPFENISDFSLISPLENGNLNIKIRDAIKRQNKIIDLSQKFRRLSEWIIFTHFLSASLTICYGGLAFMLAQNVVAKSRYIIYLSCILLELWCYCVGASSLEEESRKIADAAYFTYWYKANMETRKMIQIIIMRSQKPVVLNVPFFTPSLPAFNAICRTAGSYMTLLRTFM